MLTHNNICVDLKGQLHGSMNMQPGGHACSARCISILPHRKTKYSNASFKLVHKTRHLIYFPNQIPFNKPLIYLLCDQSQRVIQRLILVQFPRCRQPPAIAQLDQNK